MSKYQDATLAADVSTVESDAPAAGSPASAAHALTEGSGDDELVYIPRSKLAFDPDNVRKSGGTDVHGLKALIASQGLMQNLIVCPQKSTKGKATRKFGVIAGGRRLRALQALAAEGKIARDEQILCKVVARHRALAMSAAENSEREPMTVADTVVAFADMVATGAGIEDIAVAFGITPITVQRRLKLAHVSPKLFALFRAEEINLDQMMALALSDDHATQERIWESAPDWDREPQDLRRMILGEAVDASRDKLAKFVGLAAYVAAGGVVVRDLFSEADQGFIADPGLLRRLAVDKLNTKVAKVKKEGWAWVEVMASFDHQERKAFANAPRARRAPTDEEQAAIDVATKAAMDAQQAFDAYEGKDEDEDPEGDRLYEATEVTATALNALEDALMCVLPEVQALAGAVITIDKNGKTETHRCLIRAQDRKQALEICAAVSDARSDDADDRGDADSGSAGAGPSRTVSDSLCRKLTAHRTQALQVALADNTHVALASLAHALLSQLVLRGIHQVETALSVRASGCRHELASSADDVKASRAWSEMDARLDAWGERLPGDPKALLPWLLRQPIDTLQELLALCAALSVNTVTSRETAHPGDALVAAAALDMADWWTPTVGSYLQQVPKARIVEAVTEAVSVEAAAPLSKLKKGEAAARAETLLAGTRWLPSVLRAPAA